VGLKENVILGHLIPAGTGFHTFQDAEVRFRPEALTALSAEAPSALETSFPLLQEAVASDSMDMEDDDDSDETAVRATEGVRTFEDYFGKDEDLDDDEA
jgi:hypothetical protein